MLLLKEDLMVGKLSPKGNICFLQLTRGTCHNQEWLKALLPLPWTCRQWGVTQLIRSYFVHRSPRLLGFGSHGRLPTITALLKSIPKGEGESRRNSPNHIWQTGWQTKSWDPKAPICEEPHVQEFLEQVKSGRGDSRVEVCSSSIVPDSILEEIC